MAKRKVAIKVPDVNDQMAMRFAQQYIACMDPVRAAINTGVAYDGVRVDYGKAEKVGKALLNHPQVKNHIRYLNEKSTHTLKLDLQKFNDILGEMIEVTILDYLLWDDMASGYRLKPLSMLTQAELNCLKDANQYQSQFISGALAATASTPAQPATQTIIQSFDIKLLDKMRLMDLYAKVNSFYKPSEMGHSPEDGARKIREALAKIEETDGPSAEVGT